MWCIDSIKKSLMTKVGNLKKIYQVELLRKVVSDWWSCEDIFPFPSVLLGRWGGEGEAEVGSQCTWMRRLRDQRHPTRQNPTLHPTAHGISPCGWLIVSPEPCWTPPLYPWRPLETLDTQSDMCLIFPALYFCLQEIGGQVIFNKYHRRALPY